MIVSERYSVPPRHQWLNLSDEGVLTASDTVVNITNYGWEDQSKDCAWGVYVPLENGATILIHGGDRVQQQPSRNVRLKWSAPAATLILPVVWPWVEEEDKSLDLPNEIPFIYDRSSPETAFIHGSCVGWDNDPGFCSNSYHNVLIKPSCKDVRQLLWADEDVWNIVKLWSALDLRIPESYFSYPKVPLHWSPYGYMKP